MIPKIIHYVWLSNDPFPSKIKKCMETWQTMMPDYEIKRWSTENFDISAERSFQTAQMGVCSRLYSHVCTLS